MAPKKESILALNINSIFFGLVKKICRSTTDNQGNEQKTKEDVIQALKQAEKDVSEASATILTKSADSD